MTIKDIIDKERWGKATFAYLKYEGLAFSTHNAALDRIESAVMNTYLVETCDWCGKKFVKLPDHPHKDGSARCPHCMAEGVDVRQQRIAELEGIIRQMVYKKHTQENRQAQRCQNRWREYDLAQKDQRIVTLKEELDGMLSVNDNANRCIAELIEVLSDIVLGTPIDDCNRDDDGLNAHPRNMDQRIERAKSILKKEGGK